MNKTRKSTNEKFCGKYRIPSARLKNYDYASNGAYFITICTKNREHFFGQVTNGEMRLSNIGEIIADEWEKTAEIRKNVELGEWVVMPNHANIPKCRKYPQPNILFLTSSNFLNVKPPFGLEQFTPISPGNPDFTIASFVMKTNCIVFLNTSWQMLPIGKMMIIINL